MTKTRTSLVSAVLLVLAAALLALVLRPATAAPSHAFVLSVGHSDAFEVRYEGGQLVLYYNDDTTGGHILRSVSDVLMHAKHTSNVTVPNNPLYSFLGTAGSTVWVLPQTQNPALLWPGASTEDLAGMWEEDCLDSGLDPVACIKLRLVSVSGPGNFFLYTVDGFGTPTQIWNSTDLATYGVEGLTAAPAGGQHKHFNWAFSAEGTYQLTVRAEGNHTVDGAKQSANYTYTVHVGRAADLRVTKTVDNATPDVGTNVTFTVTATNLTQPATSTGCCSAANNVQVSDLLPAGLTFVSATPSAGTYDSGTGLWTIGSLSYGTSRTLTLVASVNAGTAGQTITNTATISSTTATLLDFDPDNNTASVSVVPVAATSTLVSLAPADGAVAGANSVTLTVNGSGFVNGEQVTLGGTSTTTTFVSGSTLTVLLGPEHIGLVKTTLIVGTTRSSNQLPFAVRRSSSDVDCDGDADGADALKLLRVLAGLEEPHGQCAADVNQSGIVDLQDAIWIRREVAGITQPIASTFP